MMFDTKIAVILRENLKIVGLAMCDDRKVIDKIIKGLKLHT